MEEASLRREGYVKQVQHGC